jgi:hypothetical protein
MSELLAYATVFVAAAIPWLEVLLVVPAGIVAGLAPVPTAIVGFLGNAATLVPLVLGGDRVRSWWGERRTSRHAEPARTEDHGAEDHGVEDHRTENRRAGDHRTDRSHATGVSDPDAAPKCGATPDRAAAPDGHADAGRDAGGGRGERARQLFDRFGLPGLAALGPLLTGIHVAAIVALAAGGERWCGSPPGSRSGPRWPQQPRSSASTLSSTRPPSPISVSDPLDRSPDAAPLADRSVTGAAHYLVSTGRSPVQAFDDPVDAGSVGLEVGGVDRGEHPDTQLVAAELAVGVGVEDATGA